MNFEHKDIREFTLETARDVSLSDAERETMKENILLFMKEHPVRGPFIERVLLYVWAPRAGLSMIPVYWRRRRSKMQKFSFDFPSRGVRNWWKPIYGYGFRSALAGVLIVFLIGTGTSYAAEGALPGDILYSVKT